MCWVFVYVHAHAFGKTEIYKSRNTCKCPQCKCYNSLRQQHHKLEHLNISYIGRLAEEMIDESSLFPPSLPQKQLQDSYQINDSTPS